MRSYMILYILHIDMFVATNLIFHYNHSVTWDGMIRDVESGILFTPIRMEHNASIWSCGN